MNVCLLPALAAGLSCAESMGGPDVFPTFFGGQSLNLVWNLVHIHGS